MRAKRVVCRVNAPVDEGSAEQTALFRQMSRRTPAQRFEALDPRGQGCCPGADATTVIYLRKASKAFQCVIDCIFRWFSDASSVGSFQNAIVERNA